MFGIGVFAIIFNSDNKILLAKRIDNGVWETPGGGLEQGETPEQGIIREIKEELRLKVRVKRLIGIYSKSDKAEIVFSYECEVTDGEFVPTEEVSEIGYFDVDNLPDSVRANKRERIADACKNLKKCLYVVQKCSAPQRQNTDITD